MRGSELSGLNSANIIIPKTREKGCGRYTPNCLVLGRNRGLGMEGIKRTVDVDRIHVSLV